VRFVCLVELIVSPSPQVSEEIGEGFVENADTVDLIRWNEEKGMEFSDRRALEMQDGAKVLEFRECLPRKGIEYQQYCPDNKLKTQVKL
jgi:hypothetical protein